MEQADTGERHSHVVLVAALDDSVVTHRTAGFCHILHAALIGAFDIVAEGEEGVGTQGHAGGSSSEYSLLLCVFTPATVSLMPRNPGDTGRTLQI